ncbi:MAG: dienelactone hydrolase family protein [Verrucomicrobia bacterium]|nr:dienelactone hydrolase family protein [Verrucomicrobiota bacterium]
MRGNDASEGFTAYPLQKRAPLVILCHAWKGRDEFICEQARLIASWGYVGFALDMYGKGVLGKSKEENTELKKPFLDDRRLLQSRILKALEVSSQLPYVDPQQIAVLGFGFGGICALDLARSGAPLQGAISVYGHFAPPPPELVKPIQAKILILHGYRDPVTPQKELRDFEEAMNRGMVDWQAHLYGDAMHAFATPGANDPVSGILYHPVAAKRATLAIRNFLDEIFINSAS